MILEVEKGGFFYNSNTPVLKNINLSVDEHDILAVLGRNGAGKTTMLKCIMGMLTWQEGRTLIRGKDIKQMSHREIWKSISYVPQAKTTSDLTVRNMIVLGRSSHINMFDKPKDEDYEIAEKIIDQLNIRKLADKQCNNLSGGELQMVLIGRALASDPKLIIMDEPESNLDYHNQVHVLKLIHELSKDTACILNTHYPEHALQFANKALMLFPNKTTKFGKVDEIITPENLKEAFEIAVHIGTDNIEDDEYKYIIPLYKKHNK